MDGEKLSKYQERKRALAAVDRMHRTPRPLGPPELCTREYLDGVARRFGMRPLKPPPTRAPEPPRLTAGEAELAREIRRGTYAPHSGAFLVDTKAHKAGKA